jgi:simple sugar transport system permease protein
MTIWQQVAAVAMALLAGALKASTPFLFVSLGECLTEKSGRVNLGLEGTLIMGAMAGYATAYETGNPWLGVCTAAMAGMMLGALHGLICALPRVNDIAVGIALMQFGTVFAFFLGKPYIQPAAAHLPEMPIGAWFDIGEAGELQLTPLLVCSALLAFGMAWGLRQTRWGLIIRTIGDSTVGARALGFRVNLVRLLSTAAGGALAGIGGSFLSLAYPGIWSEALSSGQGLMAVALVIFARWNPVYCLCASLLFGAAGALGPALQSIGVTEAYHLFNAVPYILTLLIMIGSSSKAAALRAAPAELSIIR